MIRNLVTLSLVPALGVASLSLSLGRFNEAGALAFGQVMAALAGIVVSVLMPLVVAKFLPLGGQTSSVGRSLIGAGAQLAATGALVATGAGAALAGSARLGDVRDRRWWSGRRGRCAGLSSGGRRWSVVAVVVVLRMVRLAGRGRRLPGWSSPRRRRRLPGRRRSRSRRRPGGPLRRRRRVRLRVCLHHLAGGAVAQRRP